MARIRTIKPTFFRSRAVRLLNDRQKLVWIGLWPLADDEGRLLDEPGLLIGDLWALSLTESQIDKVLAELHKHGRIVRYEVAGARYIQVTNWFEHQRISKPTPSVLPPVPGSEPSRRPPGVLPEDFFQEGKGKGEERNKEGEGSADGALPPVDNSEPALRCPAHLATAIPPKCGQCKDARLAHDLWAKQQAAVARAAKPSAWRPGLCRDHLQNADTCEMCAYENAHAANVLHGRFGGVA